jgi:CO/xanthine dehydrogenase FAD-binding subunit
LTDALRLMAEGRWRVLAGGTDLYPGAGPCLAGRVLDLADVAELSGLQTGQGLRIGAGTTWAAILRAELPPALRALQQAAKQVGGRQVQTSGTIGGNLCNASPAADGVPPLLALGAEVELLSRSGTRRLALDAFLLGPRKTALAVDEILTAVVIPEEGLRGQSAFVKLGARSHLVISIAMVAARLVIERGCVAEAAVAVGSCGPVAMRLSAVEAALIGAGVADAADKVREKDVASALSPIDDVRATAEYRRAAATELIKRAVAEVLG